MVLEMFNTYETMLGRPRCRNWLPLATQQLRLRHLIRLIAYNIKTTEGSLYYTLHLTTMCAPFYTSEKLESQNPKWTELDINTLQLSSASGVVLRIWHHIDKNPNDQVILAWGVSLPGLVYLGTKLADIQPVSFKENTVIFQLNGGYFTSLHCIRTDTSKPLPFKEYLNVVDSPNSCSSVIMRNASIKCAKSEVRISYNVKKLQRLHSLQQSIKNKTLDAQELRQKISVKCGLVDGEFDANPLRENVENTSNTRPLSMTTLNRFLSKQDQPTRIQRQEIAKMRKLIESARFRAKLLAQERDRKLANIRRLNQECNLMLDNNEDKNSELMSLYRQLSRDMERLREFRRSQADIRELYVHTSAQLNLRRKQLINQLLLIYPIKKIGEKKFTISDVHLPDSEDLNLVPESCLSVALGFVTHVVVMCAAFLQVPLRYPIIHIGSRSKIIDHIAFNIPDKDREFPLYTKGKDRLQFQYAVYLLNKNIAQLRWYCGLPTQDLRATLPNLLNLLQGNSDYRFERPDSAFSGSSRLLSGSEPLQLSKRYGSFSTLERSSYSDRIMLSSPISNSCEQIFTAHIKNDLSDLTPIKKVPRTIRSESGPGLSQILSAPEKSDNSSSKTFKVVSNSTVPQRFKLNFDSPVTVDTVSKVTNNCVDCNIEQGLDILDAPKMCLTQNEHSLNVKKAANGTEPLDLAIKLKRRISRSVGSYTESEEKYTLGRNHLEVGSDPLLISSENPNLSDQSLPNSYGEGRKEFLQHWFNSSPALVCSAEQLCPEEFFGVVAVGCSSQQQQHQQQQQQQHHDDEIVGENALCLRTDALVEQNSFHLVKPKQ